ncbi:uncharacterized protein SPPG_02482 [Spizellomyces punctatus DAOM BR117]|uniref:Uncharacterized protein n=1 Tax=Spizellomyces punctatus (strain DAOM BR117) TaxID=645134 RepID=A0A0L0HM33_SPIPD|nr:uncharacterized protein SPPG_02482 [Spizellomyces punctatus DAOM BR117]KND01975.1 hypothetical protein SPPG_02482 [Spizellomyces punctatus DAOM BR117]|eukprot:XP_016610014.1 hypothetical protein SPPG_02482 [Spizellomyces punctatus DAOM BR117]
MTIHTLPLDPTRRPQTASSPVHQVPPNTPVTPTPASPGLTAATAPADPSPTILSHPRPISPRRTQHATRTTHSKRRSKFTHPSDADDESDVGGTDTDSSAEIESKILPPSASDLLPHNGKTDTLAQYANLRAFVSLVITPFFQGMFYGLGEGTAKVMLGRYFGVDPLIALGGGQQQGERKQRRGLSLAGLFGRGKKETIVAASLAEPELAFVGGLKTWAKDGDDEVESASVMPGFQSWLRVSTYAADTGLRALSMEDHNDAAVILRCEKR